MKYLISIVKLIIEIYRFLKIDLLFSLIFFHLSLLIKLPKLLSNKFFKSITMLMSEGGFGHTIHDVEITKLTLEDNFLIIILSDHKRHNWELVNVWKDIDIIHLYKTGPFFSRETQVFMQKYCTFVLYKLHAIIKRKIIEFDNNFNEYYLKPKNSLVNKLINKVSKYNDYEYSDEYHKNLKLPYKNFYQAYYAYFFLKTKLNIEIIEFNRKLENIFIKKLKKVNPKNKKIINIYLRQKGRDNRCGSSIQEWEKVIYYLLKNDYFIFLTGDVHLNKFSREIRTKIFSFSNFKLSKNIFNISAPYFCDYYISEMGGGSWFGMIMKKPTLMVNCLFFGYFWGPNFYLLFKNLKSKKTNKIIPLAKSLRKYFSEIEIPKDIILENNSAEQIIQGFEDLRKKNKSILYKDLIPQVKYSWAAATNSALVSSNKIY